MPIRPTLVVKRMGRIAYGPMLALQEQCHAQRAEGVGDDTFFLLQHDPKVLTTGKNAGRENILFSSDVLHAWGVEVYDTGRGGDVTYHGPGQIVGYPIVALQEGERDIQRFVWKLEEILIRTLADFGLDADRLAGSRGVWVGDEKIAAIGVRIARWVSMHGFALNVSPSLGDFSMIVPCGIRDKQVTSMERLLGQAPEISAVEDRLIFHAGAVLGRQCVEAQTTDKNQDAHALLSSLEMRNVHPGV